MAGDLGGGGDDDPSPVLRYFGDYELLSEIARGGMGVVYRARQVRLNRIVALKVMAAGEFASPQYRERFRTEAEAAAALDHPNIVPIYEVAEAGGHAFFTMRLIDGGTLAEKVSRAGVPFSNREAAALVAKIARAVHYAHQRGVLHRDLKPGNVLLDAQAEPLLTDFGVAKFLEKESTVTATQALLGTPSYMSPEQAAGRTRTLTTATDVYGLGAILYEMLTGVPPFAGGTTLETVRQVLEKEPRRPTALNPMVARDLEVLCLRCLEKDPSRRFGSAEALADELERWSRCEPIRSRPVGVLERTGMWIRRHPRRAALLGALIAMVTGFVVLQSLTNLRLREANEVAAVKAEESRQHLVRFHVNRGIEFMNQGDLAGSLPWFVRALQLDQGDTEREEPHRVRIGAVLNQMPRLLGIFEPGTNLTAGAFSSDGDRFLIYSDAGAFAQVWDVAQGEPVAPRMLHRAFLQAARFDRDARRVLTASYDGVAQLWRADTGEPAGPPMRHEAGVNAAVFTPDETRVITGGFKSGVTIWDAVTGQVRKRWPIEGTVHDVACSGDGRWVAAAVERGVRIWEMENDRALPLLEGTQVNGMRRVEFSENSGRVLGYSGSGARVWETETGVALTPLLAHPDVWVYGARFGPRGSTVLSFGRDGLARVWGVGTHRTTLPPLRHDHGIRHAEFSRDGLRVVTASDDQTARVWDSQSGEPSSVLRHGGRITFACFSPDGRRVLTLDANTVRVWDLANTALDGPVLRVRSPYGFGFAADGHQILTADAERNVRGWDVATGEEIPLSLVRPETARPTLAYTRNSARLPHPDGQRELVIEDAAWIRETSTRRSLTPPLRHREAVVTSAFSEDGRYVATSSIDRTARVWQTDTGDPITPPLRNRAVVYQAVFGPNARRLGVMSGSGSVETWRLEPEPRAVADLESLAQLLSGRRISDSRDFEDVDSGELARLFRRWSKDYPVLFTTTLPQQTEWHWREAVLAPIHLEVVPTVEQMLEPRVDHVRWVWRARIESGRREWTNAIVSYSRALEFDPENPHLWRERGLVRQQIGRTDEALDDLSQAVRLAPDHATLWVDRGKVHLAIGETSKARSDLDRALDLSPRSAEAWEARGLAATATRDWRRAIDDFGASRALREQLREGPAVPENLPVASRTAGVDPRCLDLGAFFQCPPSPAWMVPRDVRHGPGLVEVPIGAVTLEGVPFEIRGVIQLAGVESRTRRGTFPVAARGIPIPPRVRRVHFLHGTESETPIGTVVGSVVVHFDRGSPEVTELRHGYELGAIYSANREAPRSPNAAIVWTGEVVGGLRHHTLYRTTWENPRPDEKTVMIDYRSAMARKGPCLFAITVEP